MSREDKIYEKIKALLDDYGTFKKRIIEHVENDHFPLMYQGLYEKIMPKGNTELESEAFNTLLENNYLYLLNDIYNTRLSTKAYRIILDRLKNIDDLGDYTGVLRAFLECNPRKNRKVNALSFGTKVLHTFNPEDNPILDSVVRENLGIWDEMDLDLCIDFKKAMKRFADDHRDYLEVLKDDKVVEVFGKHYLEPRFPRMKLIDMAIYHYWGDTEDD